MSLIKSISGIRGTIGGKPGDGLSPIDIVKFTYAYCATLPSRKPQPNGGKYKIVVGKDARLSGGMVENLVVGTLMACGVDVVRIGLASTPTTELAVTFAKADGGIILTASHNPRQWNALKLLNDKGEFLTAAEGQAILDLAAAEDFNFADVDDLGHITEHDYTDEHLDSVLALETVDVQAIKDAHFKVVLDAINSVGGIIMPRLLERLGVECVNLNIALATDQRPGLTHLCGHIDLTHGSRLILTAIFPVSCSNLSSSVMCPRSSTSAWESPSILTWTVWRSSARTGSRLWRNIPL